jgi:hypothetical protein
LKFRGNSELKQLAKEKSNGFVDKLNEGRLEITPHFSVVTYGSSAACKQIPEKLGHQDVPILNNFITCSTILAVACYLQKFQVKNITPTRNFRERSEVQE